MRIRLSLAASLLLAAACSDHVPTALPPAGPPLAASSMVKTVQVNVTVLSTAPNARCDVAVSALSTGQPISLGYLRRAVRAKSNQAGSCPGVASFDLPVDQSYVFSTYNTIFDGIRNLDPVPNPDGVPTDAALPNQLAVLCVENADGSCASVPKTPANLKLAIAGASVLSKGRDLTLTLQPPQRPALSCTAYGSSGIVYGVLPVTATTVPNLPAAWYTQDPPALLVDAYPASVGCLVRSLPAGEYAYVEQLSGSGTYGGTYLAPSATSASLFALPYFGPDQKFYGLDGIGEAANAKNDLASAVYGLLDPSRYPGYAGKKAFGLHVELANASDAGAAVLTAAFSNLRATEAGTGTGLSVSFNCQTGSAGNNCTVTSVSPSSESGRILAVSATGDVTGHAAVQLYLDFTGYSFGNLVVSAGSQAGPDVLPDSGALPWSDGGGSGSFRVVG